MKTLKESLLGDMEAAVNNNCVYYPKNKDELTEAIKECLDAKIYDLNCIDTSKITDMSSLFDSSSFYCGFNSLEKYKTYFNKINISKWNVSNVENMYSMFYNSKFNGDISKWDVSSVKHMNYMFAESKFNGDISKWNVSNVENMSYIFFGSKFNGDISKWNVRNVENMYSMFKNSKFNGDISKWKFSKNANTDRMFDNCPIEEKYKPKFK